MGGSGGRGHGWGHCPPPPGPPLRPAGLPAPATCRLGTRGTLGQSQAWGALRILPNFCHSGGNIFFLHFILFYFTLFCFFAFCLLRLTVSILHFALCSLHFTFCILHYFTFFLLHSAFCRLQYAYFFLPFAMMCVLPFAFFFFFLIITTFWPSPSQSRGKPLAGTPPRPLPRTLPRGGAGPRALARRPALPTPAPAGLQSPDSHSRAHLASSSPIPQPPGFNFSPDAGANPPHPTHPIPIPIPVPVPSGWRGPPCHPPCLPRGYLPWPHPPRDVANWLEVFV